MSTLRRLEWTVYADGEPVHGGWVPDFGTSPEQVAVDAMTEFAGTHGLRTVDLPGFRVLVHRPDSDLSLAEADGRDWVMSA